MATVVLLKMLHDLVDGVDGRLELLRGILVVPVQVLAQSVGPPVAAVDAVRIQHWHDAEHELVQKGLVLSDVSDQAFQRVARGHLPRVHPGTYENVLLLKLVGLSFPLIARA